MRHIVGFRTNMIWKQVIATCYYLLYFVLCSIGFYIGLTNSEMQEYATISDRILCMISLIYFIQILLLPPITLKFYEIFNSNKIKTILSTIICFFVWILGILFLMPNYSQQYQIYLSSKGVSSNFENIINNIKTGEIWNNKVLNDSEEELNLSQDEKQDIMQNKTSYIKEEFSDMYYTQLEYAKYYDTYMRMDFKELFITFKKAYKKNNTDLSEIALSTSGLSDYLVFSSEWQDDLYKIEINLYTGSNDNFLSILELSESELKSLKKKYLIESVQRFTDNISTLMHKKTETKFLINSEEIEVLTNRNFIKTE